MSQTIYDYEGFRKDILQRLPSYLPVEMQAWEVECRIHYKVNEELDAFTLMPPKSVRKNEEKQKPGAYPLFYMQDLYEMYRNGNDRGRILRYVASCIMAVPKQEEVEASGFSMDRFRDDVVFQLINYEKNQEMLKEYPHRRFLDLAVIYRILVFGPDGEWAGSLVNHSMMEAWKMTEEELYALAAKHTPEALPFMLRETGEMMAEEDVQDRMLLLGNERMTFGAAAMLFPELLERAAEIYQDSFLILPGSIHELYLVCDGRKGLVPWKLAVETANRELVDPREWLSDHVYFYDREKKEVRILE